MDHQNEIQHPWLALMGPIIGAFVGMLSETSLNIALPQLSQSLNIGNATLQWIVTGYMLVIGIILPLSSLLTKWFTTRQIITTGIGAFLIGAIISALAPNFSILLTGRMNWNDLTVNVHRCNEHFPTAEDGNRNGGLFTGNHVCPGSRPNFDWLYSCKVIMELGFLVICSGFIGRPFL